MKIQDLLLSQDITYKEVLEVTGTLTLDPNKTITLTMNNSNLLQTNRIVSRPIWPAVHTFKFIGIDESKFVGGGDVPLDSDKGWWVTGSGQLDLQGEEKTSWTNVTGAIKSGDISFTVKEANNWRVGDEIVISRTAKNATDDDVRTIKAITGTMVTVDRALTDHPMVNGVWTAEVLNLTRNLRIEGTSSGQSHLFIKSTAKHNVQYVQFRYLGPRKNISGDSAKELVTGRYALHFHHCEEATRGMEVLGCVARDCNNHAYVPHGSHGLTLRRNIGYNCLDVNFWYDMGHKSHDLIYIENVAGAISYVPGSITVEDPTTKTFGSGGFLLGEGDGNKCIGNVCFGISGALGIDGTGAYQWRNNNESTWVFKGNMAHNCQTSAIDIWQNTAMNHTLEDTIIYYCGSAGRLGAYANDYLYKGGIIFESCALLKSGSLTSLRTRFDSVTFINGGPGFGDYTGIKAGIIQVGSPVDSIGDGQPPVLYRNCKFINCDIVLAGGENAHWADIVDCTFPNLIVKGAEVARVQQGGKAYQQTASGKKDIPLFAPANWGTGDGVLVEYFSDTNFKNKVAELLQPQANFTEWQNLGGPHHSCPGSNYSIRVSGQWQPQFTDTYTFSYSMDAGGSIELFIEGAAVKSFSTKAGQKYKFELRFKSTGTQIAGFSFNAHCAAMALWQKAGETVPQSQLYSPGTIVPPVNKPPIANAGADQVIQLPINSTVLNGSGSDSDGVITAYKWTGKGTIVDSDKPVCRVTGLVEGDYVFTLQVTDDKGATGTDTVTVTVKPIVTPPPNQPPVVTVGASVNVIKTGTIFLNGAGVDPEGGALSYLWRQTSGPLVTITNTAAASTDVQKAPEGSYKFILRVTDNAGNSVEKEVSVTI